MSAPAAADAAQEAAEAIGEAIADIGHSLQELVDAGDKALAELPQELVGWLRDTLAAAERGFDDLVAEISKILAYTGSSATLRATGQAWSAKIAGPVSALAGTVTLDHLQADDRWSGVAADAYRNTLIPQSTALQAVARFANDVDTLLQDFAGSLDAFWTSLNAALAALVVALGTEIFGAMLPPVTLVAAAFFVTTIGIAVSFVKSAAESLTTLGNTASSRADAVSQRLDDNSFFPSGRWPASTTDMSDGSQTDGDPSDWTVK